MLANARFMAEHLLDAGWDTLVIDIDWYDPTARAHGYNENAPLILDEYGRQLPDPQRFPSSANGRGFGPIAEQVHALGLKLGVHMMRGIPRIAVENNLPVLGTTDTTRDIADLDHVCVWNPDNYGLNQNHPGAQAWYDAQIDQFAAWGLDFLKVDDMQTPFHADEIAAYHRAIAKAEAKYGREITLSLSPGGWVSTGYVDFLRGNAEMWRISDDLWDRWEDIYQQFARLARWAPFQTHRPLGRRRHAPTRPHRPARRTRRRPRLPPDPPTNAAHCSPCGAWAAARSWSAATCPPPRLRPSPRSPTPRCARSPPGPATTTRPCASGSSPVGTTRAPTAANSSCGPPTH